MKQWQRLSLFPLLAWCLFIFSGCLPVGGRTEAVGPAPVFSRMVRAELIFGLSNPDGHITEESWQNFVDEVITPRFRNGLTVIDISGQWSNKMGLVERERSKMVLILFHPAPDHDHALEEIRAKYKERFKQESVLLIKSLADVSF